MTKSPRTLRGLDVDPASPPLSRQTQHQQPPPTPPLPETGHPYIAQCHIRSELHQNRLQRQAKENRTKGVTLLWPHLRQQREISKFQHRSFTVSEMAV